MGLSSPMRVRPPFGGCHLDRLKSGGLTRQSLVWTQITAQISWVKTIYKEGSMIPSISGWIDSENLTLGGGDYA